VNKLLVVKKFFENIESQSPSLRVFLNAVKNFKAAEGSRYAGALAFYALFSLFPLIIVLIWIIGVFLQEKETLLRLQRLAYELLPIDDQIIRENIERVMEIRNTVGGIGLVGLLWSASSVFGVLVTSINMAWKNARKKSFIEQRLLAFGVIVLIIVTVLLLPLLTSFFNILPGLSIPALEDTIISKPAWFLFSNLIPLLITFLALSGMYQWIPNIRVPWKSALWAGLITSVGLLIFNWVFTLYLGSGLSTYSVIYGSVGAVVALLTWIYINSTILIFGAHLSAAISNSTSKEIQ
jgi:membrane protein